MGVGSWGQRGERRERKSGPNMKEDGCGRIGYEGENLDEEDGILCFEGGFEGTRVWMV
jgi:hypothetical protein